MKDFNLRKVQVWFLLLIAILMFTCNKYHPIPDTEKLKIRGKVRTIIQYNKENIDTISKVIMMFNKSGFLTLWRDSNKVEEQKVKYLYGSNHKLLEEMHYKSDSSLFMTAKYQYRKNKILIDFFVDEGKWVSIKRELLSNYKVKKETGLYFIDNDSIYFEVKYTYKNNLLYCEDNTKSQDPLDNKKYIYLGNSNGYAKKVKIVNKNDSVLGEQLFKYKFDNYGNWIEKRVVKESVFAQKYIRTIEYY